MESIRSTREYMYYTFTCACVDYPPAACYQNNSGILIIQRILHECSCFIEFVKRVGEKR